MGEHKIEKSVCLTSAVSSLCIDPWLFSSWRTNTSAHAHYTCPSTELRPACVFRSPKVFCIFPVVLSLTCGFRGHQSMSLPLHLWPMSSVLKRIPFRLQAVRVVFCCSRLQLSVFPQVPASLLPSRLLLLVTWHLPAQDGLQSQPWAALWSCLSKTAVLVVLLCCPHGSRRSLLCRTQVLFLLHLRSSKCSLSQTPGLGVGCSFWAAGSLSCKGSSSPPGRLHVVLSHDEAFCGLITHHSHISGASLPCSDHSLTLTIHCSL